MTSPGEVQGVRLLSGAIIDAKPEDAEKLIRSGKAVRVDENGDVVGSDEDDFDNQDEVGSTAEVEDRTEHTSDDGKATDNDNDEDANGGSDANDSDSAESNENTSSAKTDEQTVEAENDEQQVMAAADAAASEDATIAGVEQPVSPDNELSDNVDDKT
jgi:hypothetical protein